MNSIWQSFVAGECSPQEVQPHIFRSWQRSREAQLSPRCVINNEILPLALLRERCQAKADLVRAGKSVLPFLYRFLQGLNNLVLLCDHDGFILDSLGDPPFTSKAQQVHLSPGANWREEVKGTNAIGTVLIEKIPLRVLGWEHYVQENHFLNCWAAPICNSLGEIAGVLDISGEAGIAGGEDRLMEVVHMGARLIEQNLHLSELQRNFQFARQAIELAGQMIKDGFIAIDNRGHITEINHAGARMLGRRRDEVLGRYAGDVFGNRCWSINGNILDLRTEEKHGQGVMSRLKRITDENGFAVGALGLLKPDSGTTDSATTWVGRSETTKKVFQRAEKAARTQSTILIQGESGTGKEIVARYIHQCSPRCDKPFVALNCAAIPATLVESEMFGYAEGAFTGARRGGHPGKFEIAQEGTIFLDEIGDMPLSVQASLLRVLQEREVVRIGDNRPRRVDVRVLAATNRNLQELIDEGKFRLDLYYRLKVVTIDVPPLRERLEDVYDLVPFFVKKIGDASGRSPMGIHEDVYPHLLSYEWPGNIRELENCIESMVAMSFHSFLTSEDLPVELLNSESVKACRDGSLLERQTRQAILQALAATKGKIAPAARLLGIGRTTLYRKMEELGI